MTFTRFVQQSRQTGQIDEANRLQGLLDDAIDDSAEYVAKQRNELRRIEGQ